jgi:transcriptional regulator with XRE-family HTH domain
MAKQLMINYSDAGEQIRAARIAQHISQEEFAERVGVSPQYLSNIENGNTKAGLIAFLNIADGLGLSLDRLFSATLAPSRSIADSAISNLLEDCSDDELHIIMRSIAGVKAALRETERLRR